MEFQGIDLIELADRARDSGHIELAIDFYQRAIKLWTKAVNTNPNRNESKMYLAISYGGLGACYAERNDFNKAEYDDVDKTEHFFGVAQDILERLFLDTHDFHVLIHLIVTLQNQAILALKQDNVSRCEQTLEVSDKWIMRLKKFLGIGNKPVLAEAIQNKIRADIAHTREQYELAIEFVQQSIALAEQAREHHSGRNEINLWLEMVCYLARLHTDLEQFSQGLEVISKAVHFIEQRADSSIFLNMTKVSQLEVMTHYHFLLRATGASHLILDDIAKRAANLLRETSKIDNAQMNTLRIQYRQEFGDNS